MSVANMRKQLGEEVSYLYFAYLKKQTETLSATAEAPTTLPSSASIDIILLGATGAISSCVLSTMHSENIRKNSIKAFLSCISDNFPKKNGNQAPFIYNGKYVKFVYEIDFFLRINDVRTHIRSASITSGDPMALSKKILDECLELLGLPRESSGAAPTEKIIPWKNIVNKSVDNSSNNNAAKSSKSVFKF